MHLRLYWADLRPEWVRTPTVRSSLLDVQRQLGSGKKTRIIADKYGEVITNEPGCLSPLPDKRLYEQSAASVQYSQVTRRADLAHQGVPEMLLINKKKRGKAGDKAKDSTAE